MITSRLVADVTVKLTVKEARELLRSIDRVGEKEDVSWHDMTLKHTAIFTPLRQLADSLKSAAL